MLLLPVSLDLSQLKMELQMACLKLLNQKCQSVACRLKTALDMVPIVLLLWLTVTILSGLD